MFFWDTVEKANGFLEAVLKTADEDLNGRLVSELTSAPVNDGGQWDMIVNLVSKCGIVPQTLYPDTWNADNSSAMDQLTTIKLREDALKLRAMKASRSSSSSREKIADAKETMSQEIVRFLTLCLGPPPPAHEKFTWDLNSGSNIYQTVSMKPVGFAETTHVKKYISLVNDPRHEYDRLLTVYLLGNVWDGRPITYVSVDRAVLKAACVAMLKRGMPIFFGSDVGKQSDSAKGTMDTDLADYELGFNVKLGMSKVDRLMTGESAMTHATVLTAVHLDKDDKPVRWRVENSWSETAGTDGYFVISDKRRVEFLLPGCCRSQCSPQRCGGRAQAQAESSAAVWSTVMPQIAVPHAKA